MAEKLNLIDADKQVLIALAVRHQRNWIQREADRALKAEVERRLVEIEIDFGKVEAAVKAFGAEPTQVGWFEPIRDAVGHEAFDKAMRDAGIVLNWADLPTLQQNVPVPQPEAHALPPTASVRDLVLERLKAAGKTGAQASAMRENIEALRGTKLHDKTIGMTLYRLSIDGLVRRAGRTWFFASEAKNPGAVTPGLINSPSQKE